MALAAGVLAAAAAGLLTSCFGLAARPARGLGNLIPADREPAIALTVRVRELKPELGDLGGQSPGLPSLLQGRPFEVPAKTVPLSILLLPAAVPADQPCDEGNPRVVLADSFDTGKLDPAAWQTTSANDFRERVIDVVGRPGHGRARDYRLRLRASTIGTDDWTVKYLGVVGTAEVNLRKRNEIAFDLDWNRQANGSYLSAGLYVSPVFTRRTPEAEPNWLKFEYVGVPPGRNARSVLAMKVDGQLRRLDADGWPDRQRRGRYIERQRVKILLDRESIEVHENGRALYRSKTLGLPFSSGYLYLQMSSHSNYPAREVFFDRLVVRELCGDKAR